MFACPVAKGLFMLKNCAKSAAVNDNGLKFISLFCGCGGFDYGLERLGFKCVSAFDINKNVVDVYNKNVSGSAHVCDLRTNFSVDRKKVDFVVSGSPCQGFSTAGKRKYHDPRNSLLLRSAEIALSFEPQVYIVENVKGVIAGEHKAYWEQLHNYLRFHGYRTKDECVDCSKIGIAQLRKRMILTAWREGDYVNDFAKCRKNLHDALYGVDGAKNHKKLFLEKRSRDYLIAQRITAGNKLCNVRGGERSVPTWMIPEVFGETSDVEKEVLKSVRYLRRRIRVRSNGDADPVDMVDLCDYVGFDATLVVDALIEKKYLKRLGSKYDLTNTFNGKYRRLRWDEPSYTVDTMFGNPRYFLHPSESRGFTVREAARIQSFPDDFVFSGSITEQYKMVGNAIPPLLGEQIGKGILQYFSVLP